MGWRRYFVYVYESPGLHEVHLDQYSPSLVMDEFLALSALRSRRKLLYIVLASLSLLCLFWVPQIRTSEQWFQSEVYLSNEETFPYTAAIIYLVTLSRVPELLESLASVNKHLPGHPWPVVLFHTGDFDHATTRTDFIGQLQSYIGAENGSMAFSNRVEFVKLNWQFPKGMSTDKDIVDPVDSHRWPGK